MLYSPTCFKQTYWSGHLHLLMIPEIVSFNIITVKLAFLKWWPLLKDRFDCKSTCHVQQIHYVSRLASCLAWRLCREHYWAAKPQKRALRTRGEAPISSRTRGFSALARLNYLARPTKTAMLRRVIVSVVFYIFSFGTIRGRNSLRPICRGIYISLSSQPSFLE